jgi:hypothetical protein
MVVAVKLLVAMPAAAVAVLVKMVSMLFRGMLVTVEMVFLLQSLDQR